MFEMKFVQMKNTTTASAILFYRHMQPCVDASGALCPGEWSDWKPVPTELVSYEVFTAIKIPFMRSNAYSAVVPPNKPRHSANTLALPTFQPQQPT